MLQYRLRTLLLAMLVVALVTWVLFVLPDPVGALVLWQQQAVYFLDSTYLEAWGVVFALLAVEMLVVRGPESGPLACLMIGLSATIKEPFVLALPA